MPIEFQVTSPLCSEEALYSLEGELRGADRGDLCQGGSVFLRALATGTVLEIFFDLQGHVRFPVELLGNADNVFHLTVCDAAGRELFGQVATIRQGQASAASPDAPTGHSPLEPPWSRFAQMVKHCLLEAGDVAAATGRPRQELFDQVYAQERYAEKAYQDKNQVLYRECYDNLCKFANYLDLLKHN